MVVVFIFIKWLFGGLLRSLLSFEGFKGGVVYSSFLICEVVIVELWVYDFVRGYWRGNVVFVSFGEVGGVEG